MPAKKSDGPVKPTQMRLEPHILADLDEIAQHHSARTGITISRTDAVRICIATEVRRVRDEDPKPKKK